jgi:hypothetical protein
MKNMKSIKRNFMLPAVDTLWHLRCVTPLYNLFSWQRVSDTYKCQTPQPAPETKSVVLNKIRSMPFRIYTAAILFCLITFTGCIKEVTPSDAITTETLTSTTEGLTNAVNGAYALFKDHVMFNGTADDNNMYLRQYFQLSDFASDDIACGQVTEDPLFYSFSLDHSPTQTNTRYFWYISYKIISDCNTVIETVEKEPTDDPCRKQLLGECYFLRAFAHFNLVKLFARPYTQDRSAPGIILRLSTADRQ